MKYLGKYLAVWGSVMQLGIVVPFVFALYQMGRAMNMIDPDLATQSPDVSAAIGLSMRVTILGLTVSAIGLALILIAVLAFNYRSPWLPSVLWLAAVSWLLAESVVGLVLMAVLLTGGRRVFRSPVDVRGSEAEAA